MLRREFCKTPLLLALPSIWPNRLESFSDFIITDSLEPDLLIGFWKSLLKNVDNKQAVYPHVDLIPPHFYYMTLKNTKSTETDDIPPIFYKTYFIALKRKN